MIAWWLGLRPWRPAPEERVESLEDRTERFAVDVLKLIRQLSPEEPGPTMKRELVKAVTSVAATYRAANRCGSRAEFASRIGIVAEVSQESLFWLGLAKKSAVSSAPDLSRLVKEADELTEILSALERTAKAGKRRPNGI